MPIFDNKARAKFNALLGGSGGSGGGDSGGGLKHASGTWTPASDTNEMRITGLPFTPKWIAAYPENYPSNLLDGNTKTFGGFYTPAIKGILRTNGSGTSVTADTRYLMGSVEAPASDNDFLRGDIYLLETGFLIQRDSYEFVAGVSIKWIACG